MSPIRILIIEDDPIQSSIISHSLKKMDYMIDEADSAKVGIQKIHKWKPHIIILDMNLPDANGIEVLKKLKTFLESSNTKTIIYSSNDSNQTVVEALKEGASDYAFKKDDLAILHVRIGNIVKQLSLTTKLNHNIQEMEYNLELARSIQTNTLPSEEDYSEGELVFKNMFFPLNYVSGDIFDIYMISPNRYRLLLADATGHGVAAGLLSMSLKTEYDRIKKKDLDVAGLSYRLNQTILGTFKDLSLFTCVIAEIDLEKSTLEYSSSGHPNQYLIQNNDIMELPITNPMLGITSNLQPIKKTISLEKNFRLFLFTDGLFEFLDNENTVFGIERFKNFLWNFRDIPIDDIPMETVSFLFQTAKDGAPMDDVTMLSASRVS